MSQIEHCFGGTLSCQGPLRGDGPPNQLANMAKIEALHDQLEQVIRCLENPARHDLKFLSNRVQLGKILVAREMGISREETTQKQNKVIEEMIKTLSEYLTTLMVVAALVLTISIPWLFTTINKTSVYDDFYEDDALRILNSIMVVSMMCSSMLSTITLVIAMIFHVNLNIVMLTTEDKLWFISEHYVGICEDLLIASAVFLTLSMPFGLFVAYGTIVAYTCTGIFGLSILFIAWFAITLINDIKRHLYPKYQQAAREFREARGLPPAAGPFSTDRETASLAP